MRVDNFWPKPRYQFLHKFHNIQQRHSVHAVVRQLAEHQFLHSDLIGSLLSPGVQVQQLLRVCVLPLCVARRHTLREDGNAHFVTFADQARHRAATAEYLVVRMRGDDQD
jgi:hypothetical protein